MRSESFVKGGPKGLQSAMLSRWLCLAAALVLGSSAPGLASPILQTHLQEPALILKTHGNLSLHLWLWMVRRELDQLEWESEVPDNAESEMRYGAEPGNLWNDQPFLPLTQLQPVDE